MRGLNVTHTMSSHDHPWGKHLLFLCFCDCCSPRLCTVRVQTKEHQEEEGEDCDFHRFHQGDSAQEAEGRSRETQACWIQTDHRSHNLKQNTVDVVCCQRKAWSWDENAILVTQDPIFRQDLPPTQTDVHRRAPILLK